MNGESETYHGEQELLGVAVDLHEEKADGGYPQLGNQQGR